MKWTNIDMTLSNIKRCDGNRLVCIDNEWVYEFPIPVDYVVWRMIKEFYYSYGAYVKHQMKMQDICCNVGLEKCDLRIFENMERGFASRLFGTKSVEVYLNNYVKPCMIQNSVMRA